MATASGKQRSVTSAVMTVAGPVLVLGIAWGIAHAQPLPDAGVPAAEPAACDAGPCSDAPVQPAPPASGNGAPASDEPPADNELPANEPLPANDEPPAGTELPASEPPPPVPADTEQLVAPGETIELQGQAPLSRAEELVQSSRAITVLETERARQQTADMGDLLGAAQGVNVRRSGALGAGMRLSLNGLTDEQVRFFLDGIPLELAGFPAGLANVPVNLVDRIEIYRGVVPIQLGADALGGAVNLVTEPTYDVTRASASYQVGSFGTHRATLGGRWRPAGTPLLVGFHAFADRANNDYRVDVEVPDDRGRVQPARVPRFHDGYDAWGIGLELGRTPSRANRLLVRAFVSDYNKEHQHNPVMTIPYGEVSSGETVLGATGRWDHADILGSNVDLALIASAVHRTIEFRDTGEVVYDWFGRPIRDRIQPGEIDTNADDQVIWQDSALMRLLLTWALRPAQTLRVSVAPTFTTRTGEDRIQTMPMQRDPLTAQRDLVTTVGGLEHELQLGQRVENTAFAKAYLLVSRSEEVDPEGMFRRLDRTLGHAGIGDGIRVRLNEPLAVKASYEYATRLPGVDEIFGDGILVIPNLELEPETSHNVNLTLQLASKGARLGTMRAEANAFARLADRLIILVGDDRFFHYENILSARILGLESSASWLSRGEHIGLDASITVEDARNASSEGPFQAFHGDRIPNRPWLFGAVSAHAQRRSLWRRADTAALRWSTHYVHDFFRGWESQGQRELKQVIPAQLVHTAGLSYATGGTAPLTVALDVHNLTDERVYDFYGVQRPGRAVFLKLTAEY